MCSEFLSENLKGRDHFRDLGVDWRMILKCVFHKSDDISSVSELPFAPQGLHAA